MPLPPEIKPYYAQSRVERTINGIINNNKELTQADLNKVYVQAQVEAGIQRFRDQGANMSTAELRAENHDSKRLGSNMEACGDPRPHPLCDAHAIVAGGHPLAAQMRLFLAMQKCRIDDPINGCWLPRNTAARTRMPTRLRNAVPHSRIHRNKYFQFLASRITLNTTNTPEKLKNVLVQISFLLQAGAHPPDMMLPADRK